MSLRNNYIERTIDGLNKALLGKTITHLGYMDDESCENMGWDETTLVITLSDGTQLFAAADEEGNGAGVIYTTLDAPLDLAATVPVGGFA